jgi:hypothetical protein
VSPYVSTVRTGVGARAVQIYSAPLPITSSRMGHLWDAACLPGAGARAGRPIEIQAGAHTIIAADPLPDDLRDALQRIQHDPSTH